MVIDIHVHSRELSPCAKSGREELVKRGIELGLGGIVFTEHGRFAAPGELDHLKSAYAPFLVLEGIEVPARLGNATEHVVVLGVRDPALEAADWSYRDLHGFVRAKGGFSILAHPFRYSDSIDPSIHEYPPDAIEIHSLNTYARNAPKIVGLASACGSRLMNNSDAHHTDGIGAFHNVFANDVRNESDLLAALKSGHYERSGFRDAIDMYNQGRTVDKLL